MCLNIQKSYQISIEENFQKFMFKLVELVTTPGVRSLLLVKAGTTVGILNPILECVRLWSLIIARLDWNQGICQSRSQGRGCYD